MSLKVALVTGSGRGMGREIALRLADEANAVAVHYFERRDDALETVARLKDKGKLADAFQADLLRTPQAAGLVRKVEDTYGRLDILVNNFGPFVVKPWAELEMADWETALRGNLLAPYFTMKAALPGMRSRGWGRVVNLGYSRAERLGSFPTITSYAVAKTGLLTLTRTAAVAEAGTGVTVNMVSPGLLHGGALPRAKDVVEAAVGDYKDIAEAVAFLASEKAALISGTDLIVAGTWKM